MKNVKKQKTPATIKQYKITAIKSEVADFPQTQIKSSQIAYDVIKQFYSDDIEIYESFFILLLNRANITTGYANISQGGITGTIVDPRIILKYAVDSLACGVIVAHNHPSGNLQPSDSDNQITAKLKQALSLIDTNIIDHIILTPNNGYYSFLDNGQI
jgi:DNA repair protein RadC